MKNFNIRLILAIFLLSLLAFTCKEDNPVEPARNGSIEGHVIEDSSGLPVMNANIYTIPATSNVTTNQYGDYFIKYVPYDEYKVYCYKTGFDTASVSVSLDTGAVANADFSLLKSKFPYGSIKVTVNDLESSLPLENVVVMTEPASSILTTDSNGECLFENLSPGQYKVVTSFSNYESSTVSVNVKESILSYANIFLKVKWETDTTSLSTLTGKVIDSSSDLALAGVNVSSLPASGSTLTDADGFYKIKYLSPGSYKIISKKNNFITDTTEVVLKAGLTTTANIVLTPYHGTILGRVLNPFKLPLASVEIQTTPFTETIHTDSEGNFSIFKVNPGNYKLTASKNGFATETKDLTVVSADTAKIEIILNFE